MSVANWPIVNGEVDDTPTIGGVVADLEVMRAKLQGELDEEQARHEAFLAARETELRRLVTAIGALTGAPATKKQRKPSATPRKSPVIDAVIAYLGERGDESPSGLVVKHLVDSGVSISPRSAQQALQRAVAQGRVNARSLDSGRVLYSLVEGDS